MTLLLLRVALVLIVGVVCFVGGLIAAERARVAVDRAIARAQLAAWTDKLERTPTDDPCGPVLTQPLLESALLSVRFPGPTHRQRLTILARRAQERALRPPLET